MAKRHPHNNNRNVHESTDRSRPTRPEGLAAMARALDKAVAQLESAQQRAARVVEADKLRRLLREYLDDDPTDP